MQHLMKKYLYFLGIIFIVFFLISCEKENVVYKAKFYDYKNYLIGEQIIDEFDADLIDEYPEVEDRIGYIFDSWEITYDEAAKEIIFKAKYEKLAPEYYLYILDIDGYLLDLIIVESLKFEDYEHLLTPAEIFAHEFVKWEITYYGENNNVALKPLYKQVLEIVYVYDERDDLVDVLGVESLEFEDYQDLLIVKNIPLYEFVKWDIEYDQDLNRTFVRPVYKKLPIIIYVYNMDRELIDQFETEEEYSVDLLTIIEVEGYLFIQWQVTNEYPSVEYHAYPLYDKINE